MRQQHRDDLVDDEDLVVDADLDDDLVDERGSHFEPARPMVVARTTTTARAVITPAGKQAARRVPYIATATTGVGGLAVLGLVEAAAAVGKPALSGAIALGTCVATAGVVATLRIRFRDRRDPDSGYTVERIPQAHRRRWWAGALLHAAWFDAMALGAAEVVGPWGMAGILAGGTAALSLRWMRENRVELPTDTPPALPPTPQPAAIKQPPAPEPVKFPTPAPPDEGDLIAELWETRVAGGPNPIVPGSTLGDDRVDLPYGYQWVVQLNAVDGNITAARLAGLAEDIALRLGRDTNHVNIDRLQDGHARQDRALLTVITRDALADGVPYLGPDYRDGLIRLGMFSDGSGSPNWTARDATGPQHGMVTGGTGSGKSELLTRLGMALKKPGEWTIVFTDGDEQGRSAPLLKRIAYDFGKGPAEALEQLEALEAWFRATGDVMGDYTEDADGNPVPMADPSRQEPARKLMPCRAFNGWVWIIDEFHRLVKALGRGFVDRVEALARIIRKVGGAIYIGTQSATLVDWGDNEILRSLMAAGNCVIMRTKNSTEQLVLGDFGCDPTTLPKGGGYGFVDDPDGRKMMFRGEYDKHMARWISTLPPYRPAELPALVYASKRPPKPADPRADWEETQRRKAAILAAVQAGGPLPWEPQPAADGEAGGQPAPPISPMGGDGVAAPGPPLPAGSPRVTRSAADEQMIAALQFLAANTTSYAGRADQLVAAYRAGVLDEVTRQFAEEVMQRQTGAGPRPGDVPPRSPAPTSVPALTANAEQVLAILGSRPGPWTTGELETTATGLSKPAVSRALGVLVERGEACRPTGKNGTYAESRGRP